MPPCRSGRARGVGGPLAVAARASGTARHQGGRHDEDPDGGYYDWDVSFLGANQDAVLAAADIGIDAKDALTFDIGAIAPSMAAHAAKQARRRVGDRTGYTQAERAAAAPGRS
ncbi:hypothetical protein [Microbacterium sp. SD291]|uniref:hypothetical protein n=1 Tax=Microbacterium sp. SD291 TaxID=2782007 RepID=UPI001A975857|nr:hypothetical protein [Microbacterium sp. SD291]MBO0980158.1 hypothetical protein [Microbacterium sp. SD291]